MTREEAETKANQALAIMMELREARHELFKGNGSARFSMSYECDVAIKNIASCATRLSLDGKLHLEGVPS